MENNNEKKVSWLDLSEKELKKLTDVTVCMYGLQDDPMQN